MIKNILYLSIFTTIVVLCSVGLSIYHSSTSNTVSSDTSVQVTPIPSGFDTDTVSSIKTRKAISVDLSANVLSSGSATVTTPIPTTLLASPTPQASAAANEGTTASSSANTGQF